VYDPFVGLGETSRSGETVRLSSGESVGSTQSAGALPSISLPKGGGAIRDIGEKFAANPVTGTGSMSIPIATSPGRSGFRPQLSLTYDSASGNGPFGFGQSLSLQSITRKTDKGLPRYLDSVESDVFIISGAEDLVPVYRQDPDGLWVRDPLGRFVVHEDELDGHRVRRYRPRIEGLFARIERWSKIGSPGEVHWRSISKDNILTLYGFDSNSRIADPLDTSRIFSWLICESRDDKGNGIRYVYKEEDGVYQLRPGQADPFKQAYQLNRGLPSDPRRSAQRYLQRVLYGNVNPLLDDKGQRVRHLSDLPRPPTDSGADWLFEVRFDYGESDEADPTSQPEKAWFYRPDAFSSYRSGFEVRTCRRCERVLMLHHIPDQPAVAGLPARPGYSGVVRSTELIYDDELDPSLVTKPIYSFLKKVVQTGWKQDNGVITRRSLPPVEFSYTEPIVQDVIEEVDQESLENLPIGPDGGSYRWTDLHGEGIPGILTEQAGAWYYKRNWSPIPTRLSDGSVTVKAKLAPLETVARKPNVALSGGAEIMDLAGDGRPDVVVMDGPMPGLYEHDDAEGWRPFRPFTSRPNRELHSPNCKFIDLNGDGHADVLVTEDDAFVWHASLAEEGFGPARRVAQSLDEEKGPRIIFADGSQSIYLADLSGDGLTDIVRIRNGEVCYWPNLGYGRFGAKVTMDNAPWFDNPDQFEQKRIRLADIDGSGTTDIIYLHRDGVRLYFNQSGNGWSQPRMLNVFPRIDDVASIVPTDLLGNGTACLVWSSPLRGDTRRPMRYVNLMGSSKPHLLVKSINNLGAETRVDYAPSTKFYLRDKRDGKPWITRLPFPVHVVERVETYDHLSRNRFVTRYAYHNGFYDGVERELRGFGMVEQWDTEQFAALADGNVPADNIAAASHVPPVHTKTWFHTGVYLRRERVSRHYEHEYFREAGLTLDGARPLLLDDTILPPGLTLKEEREACRALKGSMLRQEVYADDAEHPEATPEQIQRARAPYTVTEQNFTIRILQPRGADRHAVFFTHARETISYHYERNPADPRIQHALTLEVDDYGNVLKQAAIGYGRRTQIRSIDDTGNVQLVPSPGLSGLNGADQAKQTTQLLTYTENRVTNAIESADAHRNPLPCETVTFELTGYTATGAAGRLQASDLVEPDPAAPGRLRHKFTAPEVLYEATPTGSQRRRPIERLRTLYRRDDLSGLLPLGDLQPLALAGESYKLAFTPGLLAQVFQRPRQGQPAEPLLPNPAAVLGGQAGNQGGYVQSQAFKADGRFPAGDPDDHWWIPSGRSFCSANPADDAATELAQARRHFFLPRRYRDPFAQDAIVEFDDHDLLLTETRDALGNRITVKANDYRVLQPRLVSDPNRNQTEVAFDALGMVVGTAVMGKPVPAPVEGDSLGGFVSDPAQPQLDDFFDTADPLTAAALLKDATTRIVYDLDRFRRTRAANPDDPTKWQPAGAATLVRETHVNSPPPPQGLRLQLGFSYSDGFGREIQKKLQAEAGQVAQRDDTGKILVGADGQPVMTANAVNPRWVGSGWTVFNNKGKAVRQFEPFFTDTHRFDFDVRVGVSPVLFYDPAERVVATLHPNHAYEKVVFDPWQQTTYDVNDTCAPRNAQTGDPRTDPDIGGYVAEYFKALSAGPGPPWKTWYAQRTGVGAPDVDEQNAAQRAAAHADTPATAHFDVLGRAFLTVARNRVVCPGHDLDGTEDRFATRVELDIEGNQRAVRDAIQQAGDPLGRIVMRYDYDMLGNRIHQLSMEAGARWTLNDVAGKLIRAWDGRGHNFATAYDALRRPTERYVQGTFSDPDPLKPNSDPRTLNPPDPLGLLVNKIEYGEPPLDPTPAQEQDAQRLNLRTRIYRHSDSAGIATNARLDANGNPTEAYDFKGNLMRSTRHLVSDYTAIPDWLNNPKVDEESFEGGTRYDALNRPIQTVAPHSSVTRAEHPNKFNVIQPVFNDAKLLERVDVWLERAAEPTGLFDSAKEVPSPVGVANIDYDAMGQRLLLDCKNGASTFYGYDPLTFRLTQLLTKRRAADFPGDDPEPPIDGWPGKQVQNLHYTYDPAGNITHIRDDAQQIIYFSNQRVEPSNDCVYDALYRLIQADGREHLGQLADGKRLPPTAPDAFDTFHTRLDHPGNGQAMGTYTERYVYDPVGNFLQMQHRGSDPANPGWTRAYDYLEPSLIEDGNGGALRKTGNRLTRTTLNPAGYTPQPEAYLHDAHGNMVRMPHLGAGSPAPNMSWDYKDQLHQTDLGGGGVAFYVYDASGQRVRKVVEKNKGNLVEERVYLGGFEIYRKHGGRPIGANTATLERETLHVMDDKQRIALVETRTLDKAGDDQAPRQLIRYQFGNHLGSCSLELDEQAQIISYEEYAPYGSSTYQAVRSQTETAKRYRYTGKERDEETGFSYHGARYYSAWSGRWVSCDPSGFVDGPNLFAFVRGNPLTRTDSTGRASWFTGKNMTVREFQEDTRAELANSATKKTNEKGINQQGDVYEGTQDEVTVPGKLDAHTHPDNPGGEKFPLPSTGGNGQTGDLDNFITRGYKEQVILRPNGVTYFRSVGNVSYVTVYKYSGSAPEYYLVRGSSAQGFSLEAINEATLKTTIDSAIAAGRAPTREIPAINPDTSTVNKPAPLSSQPPPEPVPATATPSAEPSGSTPGNVAAEPVTGVPEATPGTAASEAAVESAGAFFAGLLIGYHLGTREYGKAASDAAVLLLLYIEPITLIPLMISSIPDAAKASMEREKRARHLGLPPPLELGKL
jgi:RHS repeat-associated protein